MTGQPFQHRDGRLEQPDPLQFRRPGDPRARGPAQPQLQVGHQHLQCRRPGRIGRRRGRPGPGLTEQVPDQLGPQRQRRPGAEVEGGAHRHPGGVGPGPPDQLHGQPGLAHARLAVDADHDALAVLRAPPSGQQPPQLVVAPDQRPGARRARCPSPAEFLRQPAQPGGRAQPELLPEPVAEACIGGQRGRDVAGAGQPGHQPALGLLRLRCQFSLPAGPGERRVRIAIGLGLLGEAFEQTEHLGAKPLAGLLHPVVVELGQQLGPGERDGLGQPAGGGEVGELVEVEPDLPRRVEPELIPARPQVPGTGLGQSLPEHPHGAAQVLPRGGVRHVGPERGRDPRPRVQPGVQRQPGQQGPGAASGRRRQPGAVDLHLHLSEQPNPQHLPSPASMRPFARRRKRIGRTGVTRTGRTPAAVSAAAPPWRSSAACPSSRPRSRRA